MGCPHSKSGTPEKCSSCIGARARIIRHDSKSNVTIDGKIADRKFDPGSMTFGNRRKRKSDGDE